MTTTPPMPAELTSAEDFTDIVLTVSGDHGIDDPAMLDILEPAIAEIDRAFGSDVLMSSHHCNDDGETFRTVSGERDRLLAEVERLRATEGVCHHQNAQYLAMRADLAEARDIIARVRAALAGHPGA